MKTPLPTGKRRLIVSLGGSLILSLTPFAQADSPGTCTGQPPTQKQTIASIVSKAEGLNYYAASANAHRHIQPQGSAHFFPVNYYYPIRPDRVTLTNGTSVRTVWVPQYGISDNCPRY